VGAGGARRGQAELRLLRAWSEGLLRRRSRQQQGAYFISTSSTDTPGVHAVSGMQRS
jgi:hypothetical protein